MKFNTLEEICRWINTYVDNDKVANKLINLIKVGENIRDALNELCPDSSYADDVINRYDAVVNSEL